MFERFNRRLDADLIDYMEELGYDIEGFNREMMKYLLWYNVERGLMDWVINRR
ncbi:MAG: hypothetical protein NZ530_07870 [Thermodesulfobacteriaceae bacterium]|nr:hypothetical protein [Thermodesulfobacteriaceae bacterium]